METKYSSKYMTINVDRLERYIEIKKTILTEYQSDEEYKAEILKWLKIIQDEKPTFQLIDERNMRYLVVPELQKWVNEMLIQPVIKLGLHRTAFLIAKDLFAQVAVKQIMRGASNAPSSLQIKYFEKEEEAKKWLFMNELESKMTL